MNEVISPERTAVEAAAAGDQEAFRSLVEPLYRELHVLCYRMLGSFHDAEDAVQEALLRAWKGVSRYDGRASFRTWMYRVATSASLDALRRQRRRLLPQDVTAAADPRAPVEDPRPEVPWLEPYPDSLLESATPEARIEVREGVRLAFLRAIQLLTPRQRAALILHDVFDWSAAETATLLDITPAAVNSALQRARATLRRNESPGIWDPAQPPKHEEAEVARRYASAFEAGDVNAIAALLKEDVIVSMPPFLEWYDGRPAFEAFLAQSAFAGDPPPSYRLLPTAANGDPALAVYRQDGGGQPFQALAIKVLSIEGGCVAQITAFADARLFPIFGFPASLPG